MNAAYVGAPRSGARVKMPVKNDSNSSASIPVGTPVYMSLDGTDDALAVKLPSNGSQDAADRNFFGVVTDTLASGAIGESILFGIVPKAKIVRATRSDDSANWVGSTSIANGVLLSIDTVNNAFSTAAASATNASNTTITLVASRTPFAFLAVDIASFASTLSTATSYGTVLTALTKAFVRAL